MTELSGSLTKRLTQAQDMLTYAWAAPDPHRVVARVFAETFPGCVPGMMDWVGKQRDTPTARGMNADFDAKASAVQWFKSGAVRLHRPYDPRRPDRTANHFMDARELASFNPMNRYSFAVFEEMALKPLGIGPFLRCPIYKGRELVLFVALTRARGEPFFGPSEIALANRLVPTLADGLHARKCLDAKRLAPGDLANVVNAIDSPAYVVTAAGRVVLANPAACACFPRYPEWLRACAAEDSRERRPAWVKKVPLTFQGTRLYLLLVEGLGFDPEDARDAPWARRWGLPPRHAAVAACIMQGLTDKQTAERLGLTLNTVRTYVQRTFERMGVHNRAELLATVTRLLPGLRN